jgi:hypothetical protein
MEAHRTAHASGGKRSPQVLPELFGAPSGGKTQGGRQGGSAADFLLGPQASTESVGPPGGKFKGSTGWSGSTVDFLRGPQASPGSTERKPQGKTGQGASAAVFLASRTSSKAQRDDPFSSAALFGPPGQDKVADRAQSALSASICADTPSDNKAHSEANRPARTKATSRKAAPVSKADRAKESRGEPHAETGRGSGMDP